MLVGFFYGLAACMLWGFVYLIPLVLPDYDPVFIASARYVAFGAIALPLFWMEREEFRHYTAQDWISVTALGVVGNIVYYWALTSCIQHAGAPLAGMCMAVIPVLAAVVANVRDKKKGQNMPWKRLAPGLILIGMGLLVANWTEFEYVAQASGSSHFWLGAAFGVFALLLWTWYPIKNADWLREHPARSARAWSTAQGLATLPAALLMYVVVWQLKAPELNPLGTRPYWFLLIMVASAVFCSWLGIVFWNEMSQRIPAALASQIIVFETIFAVSYAHVLRLEWPNATMLLGMALLVAGVLSSLRAFQKKSP